jgi:hypothetical protein
MPRSLLKDWKNGRHLATKAGGWTVRIRWLEGPDNDIRLEMQDCERTFSVYPATRADADHIWFMFKQGAPAEGERKPLVKPLLALLVNEAGKWRPRRPNEPAYTVPD